MQLLLFLMDTKQCKEHNKTLNVFCMACIRPLCETCILNHTDHPTVSFKALNDLLNDNKNDFISSLMTSNILQMKKELNDFLDPIINKCKNSEEMIRSAILLLKPKEAKKIKWDETMKWIKVRNARKAASSSCIQL